MQVKYSSLLRKSWKDLKNNLIIFLPIVFVLVSVLALIILAVLEFFFIKALVVPFSLSPKLIISVIIVGIIDLFLLILINSAISAMSMSLLKVISSNKKATKKDMWLGLRKYTLINFKISLIKLLMIFAPIVVLVLLVLIAFMISKTLGILLAVILALLAIFYIIIVVFVLAFGLFFLDPIITENKSTSAFKLIKQSLKYTKENLIHVLLTWLIITGINLGISLVNRLFGFFTGIFLLFIVPMLIFIVISVIAGVWLKVFLFNAYFNKNLKK